MNMNMTTMNTNQKYLGQFARPLVELRANPVRFAPRPVANKAQPAQPALWRVTLAEARGSLTETILFAVLTAAGAASLGWLALQTYSFFLSWDNFAIWVRSALL
jgi:hypothetical protein